MTELKNEAKGTGLEPNVAMMMAYLFDILGGLIFFLIEKDNKVRFAGAQSMSLGVFNLIIWWVVLPMFTLMTFGFGVGLYGIYGLAYLALKIYLCVTAYQGKEVELPVIGKIAKSFVK